MRYYARILIQALLITIIPCFCLAHEETGLNLHLREIRQVYDCIRAHHVSQPSPETILKAGVNRLNNRSKKGGWKKFPYGEAWDAACKGSWNSLGKVLKNYFSILKPVQEKYAYRAFITGMLDSPAEGYSKMRWHPDPDLIRAKYEAGSGILIGKNHLDHNLEIFSVLPGSPAHKSGIAPGDQIIKINNYNVQPEDSIVELQSRLIGPLDTKLTLVILREGKKKKVELWRKKIDYPYYLVDFPENGIGRIKFNYFPGSAGVARRLLSRTLKEMTDSGMKGIILDLRGCTGNDYQGAMGMVSNFLARGEIFTEVKSKDGNREVLSTVYYRERVIPAVILIDSTTREAAELMAAAISEQRKYPLVGETTAGIASVQKEWFLHSGNRVILAIGSFITPGGKNPGKNGIKPTYRVKMPKWKRETPDDKQAAKARELLKKMIKKSGVW
ncbi:MAG: PDZ domain-containing protein [Candidatus Eremiobacteraeota bacterium]|nr:PDZ domain-containing protein [Candidatus Eremiobacteraeota bacterium]